MSTGESQKISLDTLELAQALLLLDNESLPEKNELVVVPARSLGDGKEVVRFAASLMSCYPGSLYLINGFDGRRFGGDIPGEASEGAEVYTQWLESYCVDTNKIYRFRDSFHTKQENDAIVDFCIENCKKHIIVVTWPHQKLRVLLGLIASMREKKYWLKVHVVAPERVDWGISVSGSQSRNFTTRFGEITAELERVSLYQVNGKLATLADLIAYLRIERLNIK